MPRPTVPVPLDVAERVAWPLTDADRKKGQEQVAAAVWKWRDQQPRTGDEEELRRYAHPTHPDFQEKP